MPVAEAPQGADAEWLGSYNLLRSWSDNFAAANWLVAELGLVDGSYSGKYFRHPWSHHQRDQVQAGLGVLAGR
jgi:hypothetical protein